MHVLLTNDDCYGAAGLEALRSALAEVAAVTVVAPAENESGTGRVRSHDGTVAVHDREHGYAVEGTPGDCVAVGLRGLDVSPDVVVSGCNHGPNLGAYILGHSGTVGAAVEAAFLGAPAIAVSAYHPEEVVPHPPESFEFSLARRVVVHLLEGALGSGVFDAADILNVNVPVAESAAMQVTRPMFDHDVAATMTDDGIAFEEQFWRSAGSDAPVEVREERERYPEGTDRRAMLEGEISVSPLTGPHAVEGHGELDRIATTWLE